MRLGLTARIALGGGALALVLVGVLLTLLMAVGDLRDADREVRHTDDLVGATSHLRALVLDVESGHRGYVIALHPSFLAPWARARRQVPGASRRLESLATDTPAQRQAARRLTA